MDNIISNDVPKLDVLAPAYVVGASNGHLKLNGNILPISILEHYANGTAKIKLDVPAINLIPTDSFSSLGGLTLDVSGEVTLVVDHIDYDETEAEGHWFLTQEPVQETSPA